MNSNRFRRPIFITRHARERMAERGVDEARLLDLIDTGTERYKDANHLWIHKHYEGRHDNLICAAVVLEDRVVVKTLMHHFTLD